MLKISDSVNYQLEDLSKDIELEVLHIWINSEMCLYSIFESVPYTAEKRASAVLLKALFFQNLMPSLVFPLRNPHQIDLPPEVHFYVERAVWYYSSD